MFTFEANAAYKGAEQMIAEQSGSLNFGLNQKAKIIRVDYIDDVRKNPIDANAVEALKIVYILGEKEVNQTFLKPKGIYKGRDLIKTPEAVMQAIRENIINVVLSVVEALTDKETAIKAYTTAFAGKSFNDFKGICEALVKVFPKNTTQIEVDLFLEYQNKINSGANRTYLQVPQNFKQGMFICKHVDGQFKEIRKSNPADADKSALVYTNTDTNELHSFTRNGWFVKSNYAKQQTGDGTTDSAAPEVNIEIAEGGY
jgi:hypothetical protein